MGNGIWISVIGIGSLAAVIWAIMRDAARSPAVTAMHEPAQVSPPEALPPLASPQSAGDNWRGAGMLVILGGAVGLPFSLFLNTTVETYASDVVNLDLMFRKGVAVACSLTAIGAGLFCLAVGAIIGAIHAPKG